MAKAKKKEGSLKVFFWCLIGLIFFANRKALLHVAGPTALGAVLIGVARPEGKFIKPRDAILRRKAYTVKATIHIREIHQ